MVRWASRFQAVRSAGRQSVVRQLTAISREAISLYLVDIVYWNLAHIFLTWVHDIAERVLKVRGQWVEV